jgi:hypothetical protein
VDYREEEDRRLADERIRAYVGERLAQLPPERVEMLAPEQRERYDRLLMRSEFLNQAAFHAFLRDPAPEAKAALALADEQLKAAADELAANGSSAIEVALQKIEAAFDQRDAAMQNR